MLYTQEIINSITKTRIQTRSNKIIYNQKVKSKSINQSTNQSTKGKGNQTVDLPSELHSTLTNKIAIKSPDFQKPIIKTKEHHSKQD